MKNLLRSTPSLLVASGLFVSIALAACSTQQVPATEDEDSLGGASSGGSETGGSGLGGVATGGAASGGDSSTGGTENLGGSGTGGGGNEPDPECVEVPGELAIWWNQTPFTPEDPAWDISWAMKERDVVAHRGAAINGVQSSGSGPGPVGWALSFTENLILTDFGQNVPFQSVEFWIKTSDTGGQLIDVPGKFRMILKAGKVQTWFRDGDETVGTGPESDKSYRLDSGVVNDGKNHHVATTLDADSHVFKLFVDGEVVDSVALAETLPEYFFFAEIGGSYMGGSSGTQESPDFFLGQLDEISFYGGTLTASEVEGIHAASTAGKCLPD